MNSFIPDAAILGLKEALKLIFVWFVLRIFLRHKSAERLLFPFYAGLALTAVLFVTSFFWPPGLDTRDILARLVKYVFFIFFMASIGALYLERRMGRSLVLGKKTPWTVTLVLTVFYFAPDIVGSVLNIRELSLMAASPSGVYLWAAVAFIVPLLIGYSFLRGRGASLGPYLGLGQFLLILALIKLLGGTSGSFVESSLIPAVQRGAMKFIHDFVHQIFVFLMVPDHPLFATDVWNYIGFLFGSNFGLAAALVLMLLPPLAYLYAVFTDPLPEPNGTVLPSERRKHRALARRTIQKRALPVVVFILVVFVSWYARIGAATTQLYLPLPKPVVADKGTIIIPLTDPTMDLMDGNLHKFSITRGAETVNFLVIKRQDGKLAVALDACEICPPEGYGLVGDKVVCVYCRTPIPIDSLGKEGGCNPIPLRAEITDKDIRIDVRELDAKWLDVKSGKSREGIR